MGRATLNFFCPAPGALGMGQKVKYHLISITKSISKIFMPNFVCVLTNERYKTYQTGFSFGVLGESKTLAWGFAMALYRLRALVSCLSLKIKMVAHHIFNIAFK